MNYELKRVGVWSVAKISFVLGGLLGFLIGLFLWMLSGLMMALPLRELSGGLGELEALGAAGILMPFLLAVFYGVVTMVANAIMAGVYNVLAGIIGGVEVSLAALVPATYAPAPQPAWTPPAPPQPPAPSPPAPSQPPPPPAPPPGDPV